MGLFHFKKTEKSKTQGHGADMNNQTIDRLVQEAYRANPRVYEKEDGTLLVGFVLTEDTDSLFPIVPEKQWALEGKTISEWIITMVSLTNPQGGVIGQIEYHDAIKRLEPFIITKIDNWALIRAMTHAELSSLLDGEE